MSTEAILTLYNFVMLLTCCFTAYQLGQIREMDRQAEIRNRESQQELERIYRARRA